MLARVLIRSLVFCRLYLLAICCYFAPCQAQDVLPSRAGTDQQRNAAQVKEDVTPIECRAVIVRRTSGIGSNDFLVADVDLQTLAGGKKYRLNIILENPFTENIQYSSVGVSCDCINFSGPADRVIPALDVASFVMELNVPNSVSERGYRQQAKFVGVNSIDSVLLLNVDYEVNNVFGFRQGHIVAKIAKSEATVDVIVPFAIVSPLKLDDLELSVSDSLSDFTARIVGDDSRLGSPYVNITVPSKDVPRHGIVGELTLVRRNSQQKSLVVVSIRKKDPVEIRPESVRLTWNSETQKYAATAILRIDSTEVHRSLPNTPSSPETESNKKPDRVEVRLLIDDAPVQVAVKRMGQSGIYQLTIDHDGPFANGSNDTLSVRWVVAVNGEEIAVDSTAFLPSK